MELALSFSTEENTEYIIEKSPLGSVYIPIEEVEITGPLGIRYERHPWIETFEFDGLKPRAPRRRGYGDRTPRSFVPSLANIYATAYEDYEHFGSNEEYFGHIAHRFMNRARCELDEYLATSAAPTCSEGGSLASAQPRSSLRDNSVRPPLKLFRLFCGFTENLWREGNRETHDIALGTVLPIIQSDPDASAIFYEHITQEFRDYLAEYLNK